MDGGNANHHFAPGRDGAGAVQGGDERRRRLLRAVTFPVAADQVLLAGVGGLRRAGRSLALRRWARVMSGAIGGSRASAGVLSRVPLDRRARSSVGGGASALGVCIAAFLQAAGVSESALAMLPRNPREHAGVAASPGRFLKRRRHVIQRPIRSEKPGALRRDMVQRMCKDAAAHD